MTRIIWQLRYGKYAARWYISDDDRVPGGERTRVILNSTYVARYDILAIPPKGQGHISKISYLATDVEWKMTIYRLIRSERGSRNVSDQNKNRKKMKKISISQEIKFGLGINFVMKTLCFRNFACSTRGLFEVDSRSTRGRLEVDSRSTFEETKQILLKISYWKLIWKMIWKPISKNFVRE